MGDTKSLCYGSYTFYMKVSRNYEYLFEGPHNKDYSFAGSILGSPCLGNYHIAREPLGERAEGFLVMVSPSIKVGS